MELNEDLSSDSISVKKCLESSSIVTDELKNDTDIVANGIPNKSPECGDKEEGDVDNEDGKDDNEKESENAKKESQNIKTVIEDNVDFNEGKNTIVVQNGVTEESTVQIEDHNSCNDSSFKENDEVINLSITKKAVTDESTTEIDEKSEVMDLSKEVNGTGGTPNKKKPQKLQVDITPRRSSRNLNKQKSYAEKDLLNAQIEKSKTTELNEEIEEVIPKDPLADDPKLKNRSKPIVINDTKGLIEFASNTKPIKSNIKKEPTLVIIDTNSILSGKGPIPISHAQTTALIGQNTEISLQHHPVRLINNNSFKTGAPGYSTSPSTLRNPPQIKPIIVAPINGTSVSITGTTVSTNLTSSATPKAPAILPSLTDDMFVVEAPSFIVPYVYEKPPKASLKLFIERLEKNIKEIEEKEKMEKESKLKKEIVKSEPEEEVKNEEKMVKSEPEEVKNEETETIDKNGNADVKLEVKDEELDDEKMEVNKEDESLNLKIVKSESTIDSENKEAVVTEDLKKSGVGPEDLTTKVETKNLEDATEKIIKKPSMSYFDNPLGKFFMHIGLNLVQEHVQTDLLRTEKRKRVKDGAKCADDVNSAINTLAKTLEFSKETNDPFKLEFKKCDLCSFKTESILVMNHHLETPHMKNYIYRCNFCQLEFRSPSGILFHMEAEHCIRGRLERAPAFNQCPNCPFEDNQKGKLTRHLVSCSKKYRPERNQEPPLDWEPPAKIPRVTRNRPPSMNPTNSVYQSALSGVKQIQTNTLLPKLMHLPRSVGQLNMLNKNRPIVKSTSSSFVNNKFPHPITVTQRSTVEGMLHKGAGTTNQPPGLLPATFPITAAQLYQQQSKQVHQQQQGLAAAKLLQQSSISITPLPRQNTSSTSASGSSSSNLLAYAKPGKPHNSNNKTSSGFVICEICDGYIKDLEQLRNHMQWIHKVKIHPKMIYNRPPLNCQKCQFRFFTDQGLERHLLGSHGLVTSSMQEAANKGKDSGRCPVCGRVYQWKLLNHVARDHNMPLKPAHLSYKCTVCTATFGMYKQFESHVYSAHSVVAKRSIENKKPTLQSSSSSQNALLKPLKINNEITIIPQPARIPKQPNNKSR